MSIRSKATILPPDTRIKDKLANRKLDELVDEFKLKKAGKVVRQNIPNFQDQAKSDMRELADALVQLQEQEGKDPIALQNISSLAYRIKGIAGTFGYHLATQVSKDLFNYLGSRKSLDKFGMIVTEAYIKTLQSIFTHDIYGDGGDTGSELLESLQTLLEKEQKPK